MSAGHTVFARRCMLLVILSLFVFACGCAENSTQPALGLAGSTLSSGPSGIVSVAADIIPQEQESKTEEVDKVFKGPGGEKSLEDMLHWAISNSDHEQLRSQAEAVRNNGDIADVLEQRKNVQELLDYMRQQPTETDVMKDAIEILHDQNATEDEQHRALQALQVLVEPIDNANNLGALNGIDPVVARLGAKSDILQLAAAYVIGTAASNNVVFQKQLLAAYPDVFDYLLDVATSDHLGAASKGLYAVSSLVRNLPEARTAFYSAGGWTGLKDILVSNSVSSQIKRKALNLIADLINADHELKGAEDHMGTLVNAICTLMLNMGSEDVHDEALLAVKEMAASPIARTILLELPVATVLDQVKLQYQTAQSAVQQHDFEFEYYEEKMQLCTSVLNALKDKKVEL